MEEKVYKKSLYNKWQFQGKTEKVGNHRNGIGISGGNGDDDLGFYGLDYPYESRTTAPYGILLVMPISSKR